MEISITKMYIYVYFEAEYIAAAAQQRHARKPFNSLF